MESVTGTKSFVDTLVLNKSDILFADTSVPSANNTFLIAKNSEKQLTLDEDMTVIVEDKGSGTDDATAPISNLTMMKRTRIKFTIRIRAETDGIDHSNATHNCIEQINSILDGLAHTIKGVKAMIYLFCWNEPRPRPPPPPCPLPPSRPLPVLVFLIFLLVFFLSPSGNFLLTAFL